jgi:hypothetical protein
LDQAWQQNVGGALGAAIGSGAAGVVLILDPAFDANDVGNLVSNIGGAQTPVPVLAIRNDIAAAWLKGTEADLTVATPADAAPRAVTGVSFRMKTAIAGSSAMPPNVVGVLEGSDPTLKNTYVVYSAHMDHVGVGRPNAEGDSIYNGAHDNAVGIGLLLEMARVFGGSRTKPQRSILFAAVTAEEKGLLGSAFLAQQAVHRQQRIVANLNIDMPLPLTRTWDFVAFGAERLDVIVHPARDRRGRVGGAIDGLVRGLRVRVDALLYVALHAAAGVLRFHGVLLPVEWVEMGLSSGSVSNGRT